MIFKGVFTALITPFKSDGDLDEEVYSSLVKRQIESGVSGIVPCGTTGESPTLSLEEHEHVIDVAVKLAKDKCPVIAGAGSNSTKEAVRLSLHAQEAGADAVLSVNPYYNKPTQLGLYRHFKAVADAIYIPVVLYNIAGRTGVNLETETLLKLKDECPNIVAVKEASGNLAQMQEVIDKTPDNFSVLSGDDNIAIDLIKMGGQGVISVASNIIPKEMTQMVNMALSGKISDAQKIESELKILFNALFLETNPIPVKTAMAKMGLCEETFRLPLCEFSSQSYKDELFKVLKELSII
jgi:4-hydroxy-tetrahydrodipicolinate synthase